MAHPDDSILSLTQISQLLGEAAPRSIDPQFSVLRLASALLARLLEHRDYEAWAEEDRDAADGLLRELIHQAVALRPRLVDGEPDLPPGAEVLARADQIGTPGTPEARKAVRLLAATVLAFRAAGLDDGAWFAGLAADVWGLPDSRY